jgi:hypothetical protein
MIKICGVATMDGYQEGKWHGDRSGEKYDRIYLSHQLSLS